MRDGITKLTFQQIEHNWSQKIKKEYEGLNSAEDIIGFLKSPRYTVTFRYALCRFLREFYGKKKKDAPEWTEIRWNPPEAISDDRWNSFPADGNEKINSSDFHAVFSNGTDTLLPEEIEDYISFMMLLAEKNGMKDEIQSKLLRKYLSGKQENVARDTLFKLAFAFGMDCEYVCEMLESLDEVPYNFRRPEECIYFFCQYSEEHNNWETAQSLIRWYNGETPGLEGQQEAYAEDRGFQGGTAGKQNGSSIAHIQEGQSRMMEDHISVILNNIEESQAQITALKEYMDAHRGQLQGYSQSSYRVFEELMDELFDITNAKDDTELSIHLWEPIWMQYYTKKSDKTGVNRSDFIPWKNLLDLPKTVYEKPLWRARIQKLRRQQVPVEKRDILFLNCMIWTLDRESEGGMDAVQEFIMETNDLLLECGLSVIYPPNPYDRMILLAISSESPYDVLSDVFRAATDEEKLQEQMKKGKS